MEPLDIEAERLWLRQLLDALPAAVVVYDADGRVLLANRQRLEQAGSGIGSVDDAIAALTPTNEDGSPIAHDDLPSMRALRGEQVSGQRLRVTLAGGRAAVVEVNAAPLRDDRGGVVGSVLVFHDITDISDLDRARRDLFTMTNHDLRTPLTAIHGLVQLARRQMAVDPGRATDSLRRAEGQIARMLRLINDLLDVARFETGAIPIEPTEGDLIASVRAAVERRPDHLRILVTAPEGALRVRYDPDRVDQILDNLLANALRHTARDTQVEVRLSGQADEVRVAVVDRGPGIAPEEHARLFKPFYQTPRGRQFGGTGLGLHISRRIAEAHGGRLWLESTGPEGSTFTLALPRA